MVQSSIPTPEVPKQAHLPAKRKTARRRLTSQRQERRTKPITITYHNDQHTSTRAGFEERGILRFDFTNDGIPRRFFVMPEYCVVFNEESPRQGTIPNASWFVHLVDAIEQDPDRGAWLVEDREIDVIVETDLRTYRIIDLDDFGQAVSDGRIPLQDAPRLLTALQRFLDTYLHGGGKWPPEEVRNWIGAAPMPCRVRTA